MNTPRLLVSTLLLALAQTVCYAQTKKAVQDSLFINDVEEQTEPDKVLHAEPLYIDLIRDLGARKGEKEWNVGLGMTDKLGYDTYEALIEYEWAPINRLGLEVELPFLIQSPMEQTNEATPPNQFNIVKVAAQWTFLVNQKAATSMAIGYINEFEFNDQMGKESSVFKGNVYNPFLVVAKRWGQNFHSLIYTGPVVEQHYQSNEFHAHYDINTNFHYMITGTKNFVGVEINQSIKDSQLETVLRPQMRLEISNQLMVGIVVGIPTNKEHERISSFLRLIWEPKHH